MNNLDSVSENKSFFEKIDKDRKIILNRLGNAFIGTKVPFRIDIQKMSVISIKFRVVPKSDMESDYALTLVKGILFHTKYKISNLYRKHRTFVIKISPNWKLYGE